MLEKTLEDSGLNSDIATLLAKAGCERLIRPAGNRTRKVIEKGKKKIKRKVSKYQQKLGQELKKLKKKHPRTPVNKLMKRAHRATKKALK